MMQQTMILIWITALLIVFYMAGYDRGKRFVYKNMCPFNKDREGK